MLLLIPYDSDIPAVDRETDRYGCDRYFLSERLRWFPSYEATQDRVVLEIQRGCIRGCRFCQAGMLYRPIRERDLEHAEGVCHCHAEEYRT